MRWQSRESCSDLREKAAGRSVKTGWSGQSFGISSSVTPVISHSSSNDHDIPTTPIMGTASQGYPFAKWTQSQSRIDAYSSKDCLLQLFNMAQILDDVDDVDDVDDDSSLKRLWREFSTDLDGLEG